MESNKQTATEWLFKQLWDEPKDKLTWYAILKQAKEMEKQQILIAYDMGDGDVRYQPEQYYEQTYGGNNE
jgi:hypothetical protein